METVLMRKTAGFTLIELLLGLFLLAILLASAIPAFRTFIQNNRLDAAANEFVAAAHLARAEAIKRGRAVTFCASSNGTSCGDSFRDGWIVIVDPDKPDTLIQSWPSPGDDFAFTPLGGRVDFRPSGCADANSDGECKIDDRVEFDIVPNECSNDNARHNARQILVELTGRVASTRKRCP